MDRAYEGDDTRQLALDLGLIPVVPPKTVMTRLEIGGALTRYRRELDDILAEYRPEWLIVERTIQGARFIEDYTFAA